MIKLRFVNRRVSSHNVRILQQYGEIDQAPNCTDSDGNPIYDGPTIEGWQDVPCVDDYHENEMYVTWHRLDVFLAKTATGVDSSQGDALVESAVKVHGALCESQERHLEPQPCSTNDAE